MTPPGAPPSTGYAITLGVPFDHSRWFRGRESTIRTRSRCPDGDCCQRAPAALAERWEGMAWPSARAHSHVLSVLPSGAFPGVDDVDIYEFLDRHEADLRLASGGTTPRNLPRKAPGDYPPVPPVPGARDGCPLCSG